MAKSNGKLYWYGMSGLDALLETDGAGNNPTEYVFFGGKRIARRDPSGAVFYYFSNHLGSTSVITNSAGSIVEESDYYPFGGERVVLNNDPNPYKFTGKERDTETGLDYFVARYFSSGYGRFLSADPLNIPNLRTIDHKKFRQIIAAPQNWNAYTYTLNNPANLLDPDGFLTVVVHGTWADPDDPGWQQLGERAAESIGDENVVVFRWSGGNTDEARQQAAQELAEFINNYEFAEGETLNIVAHSHGGNVAFLASHQVDRQIDTMVTLGTPIREYRPNMDNVGELINVYSTRDKVQVMGGCCIYTPGQPRLEMGRAGRTLNMPGVRNVDATEAAGGGARSSHSRLWQNAAVWAQRVAPEIRR